MMKRLFVAFCLLVGVAANAQTPQFLNYQGIARNSSGTIVNTPIGIQFEILQGSSSGTVVYEETNNLTPSSAGIFNAAIGGGSPVIGTFSTINWANGPYFIRVSIDPAGGTSYSTVGTSQLLSVPYALYAESTKPSTLTVSGNSLSINNGNSVTLPAGTTYTAGTGISISGGTITNTAPATTLTAAGLSSITGTSPNYTIDVPPPSLNYNTVTQELTLTQGTVVTTATITTSSASVSITGSGVSGSYPNYTITPTPATSITATGSSILVNGTNPSFTIVPQPSLTVTGNQLSITDGNTVTLPTGTTYTNGLGIAFTSGTVITNTAMDKTVTIDNGTNVIVNGTYPNFTVNAVPTLSLGAGILSISGGNSVTLPVAAAQTSINAGTNITVGGTAPSYTVNTPTYSLNFSNSSTGTLFNGVSSSAVSLPQPTLTISGTNSNVISAGSNSITIPTYTAGNGLTLSGTAPNFTIGTVSTGTSAGWSTLGNTATNPSVNFLGTTDAQDLVFRTANSQRMRIFNSSGNIGIGNITTSTELLQVETGSNTAVSILSGTNSSLFFGNAGNHFAGSIKYDNTLGTMSFGTGSASDRIFIDPSGRVAIGNNFTVSELDVNGSLRLMTSRLFLGAVGGVNSGYTGIYETGSDLRFAIGRAGAPSNPPFASAGNSYDAMTIDSPTGYVGIGTNSPGQQLHLFSSGTNIGLAIDGGTAGRARLGFLPGGVDNGELGFKNHLTFGTISDATLVMSTEHMRLTSAGNLGIGTTSPGSRLHVTDVNSKVTIDATGGGASTSSMDLKTASAGTATFLKFNSSGRLTIQSGGPYNMQFLNSIGGSYQFDEGVNSRLFIAAGGNIGMGTTSPSSLLHLNGGSITIQDGSQGAGRVLTSNSSGTGTWKIDQIAFFCGGHTTAGTTINYTASQTATVVFASGANTLAYNNGGAYSIATGMFTAPVAGVYKFDAVCVFAGATNGYCQLKLRHSSGNLIAEQEGFYNTVGQNWWSGNLAGTVHLNAGEKVYVEYYAGSAGGASFYQDKSSFSGHLVYAD